MGGIKFIMRLLGLDDGRAAEQGMMGMLLRVVQHRVRLQWCLGHGYGLTCAIASVR